MQPFVEKYKPTKIEDFAGLARPKTMLRHLADHPYPSSWLLLGPSGLGKTTMALALAEAIGGEVHHIPSKNCDLATVESIVAKCHYYPWSGQWHFVLVDEADQMSRAAQLAFLSKLDTTAAPPNTIFLFTANATSLLEDRFLSRCRTIQFDPPTRVDIAALLQRVWMNETAEPCPDFLAIADESKSNIRAALMTLEMELIAGPQERFTATLAVIPSGESTNAIDAFAASRLLGINVATLYNRVKMGRIPQPDRTGSKMTWNQSQLIAAL